MLAIIIGALTGFIAGKVHERWSHARWVRSFGPRDPADMVEEF